MISGTEIEVLNCVARLKKATKVQIRKHLDFSFPYTDYLCRYLFRKGYLSRDKDRYSLTKKGISTLLREDIKGTNESLVKEIASEVAKEISGELKETLKGITIPVKETREEREGERKRERENIDTQEAVKIKTDFEFPVEDESLSLESNIDKIGVKLEKEESDIEKSVKLFREIQKKGRKK